MFQSMCGSRLSCLLRKGVWELGRDGVRHGLASYLASVHQSAVVASQIWQSYTLGGRWEEEAVGFLQKQIAPSLGVDLRDASVTQRSGPYVASVSPFSAFQVPTHWIAHVSLVQLPTAGVWLTAVPDRDDGHLLESSLFQTALRRGLRIAVGTSRHHHLRDILAAGAGVMGLRAECEK
eukprot:1150299-Amphidinium_carterae.1